MFFRPFKLSAKSLFVLLVISCLAFVSLEAQAQTKKTTTKETAKKTTAKKVDDKKHLDDQTDHDDPFQPKPDK